jgi:hypothetical protein
MAQPKKHTSHNGRNGNDNQRGRSNTSQHNQATPGALACTTLPQGM